MSKLSEYIKGSAQEMKKVSWPTKKETKNYAFLVMGVSLAVAAFLGGLDFAFSFVLGILLKQ